LLVAIGLTGLLAGAVANALPAFAVDSAVARGIAQGPAGVIFALGSAAAILARLGSGWFVDRRRSPGFAELAGLTSLGGISLLALSLSGGSNVLFVAALIAGFGTAWGWPGLIYYATVRSHPATPAAATGLVLSCVYLGNILGPAAVGLLAEHGSYERAWAVGAGVLVLATAATLVARRLEQAQSITRPPDTSIVTPVR
jgi:predicted MFS family arabinose efflux permease